MPGFRRYAPPRRAALAGPAAAVAMALSGCGGAGPGSLAVLSGGPVPYVQSTIYSPIGYSAKQIDDTHYLVRADGDARTTPARLERMAMTRAAELGTEEKLDWFKIESSEPGYTCGKKVDGFKGPGATQNHTRSHKLRVAYAKTQADPAFQRADAAFTAAKAALEADVATPEMAVEAEADLKRACDKR